MNSVYIAGQARHDLMAPECEEINIPEDFLDFILYDELRLDNLPLHLVDSVTESLLTNQEFVAYLNLKYQAHVENNFD